uniref:Uncharacterized protein n=1 Tax=Octopus bimaculoides TaxID=37653 RepID=A0A0L8HID8_OCTBM
MFMLLHQRQENCYSRILLHEVLSLFHEVLSPNHIFSFAIMHRHFQLEVVLTQWVTGTPSVYIHICEWFRVCVCVCVLCVYVCVNLCVCVSVLVSISVTTILAEDSEKCRSSHCRCDKYMQN